MKIENIHEWDLTPKEAVALQRGLVSRLSLKAVNRPTSFVAGLDISFKKGDPRVFAGVVVMRVPEMESIEEHTFVDRESFPYIPGLLAFREIPPLLKVLKRVETIPDAILCDGQGVAHPRRMGLAAHLGLFVSVPTIGCAKSCLVGTHEDLGNERWAMTDLIDRGEVIGKVVRTRKGVKPVFISPGNHTDLQESVAIARQCITRYRLPEPIRRAHLLVNRFRKKMGS